MGKKRKGDDGWQLDQKELAFAQRLYTPEQKKMKKVFRKRSLKPNTM